MVKRKLDQFGVIGNGTAVALICNDGAVGWLCTVDSQNRPLLCENRTESNYSTFSVRPPGTKDQDWECAQSYVDETNLLQTRFRTATGDAEITDFIPLAPSNDSPPYLLRRVRGTRGHIRLEAQVLGANDSNQWCVHNAHAVGFEVDSQSLTLLNTTALHWHNHSTSFALQENETVWFALYWTPVAVDLASADLPLNRRNCDDALEQTRSYWRQWLNTPAYGLLTAGDQWRSYLSRILLTMGAMWDDKNGRILGFLDCAGDVATSDNNPCNVASACSAVDSSYDLLHRSGHQDMAQRWLSWCTGRLNDDGTVTPQTHSTPIIGEALTPYDNTLTGAPAPNAMRCAAQLEAQFYHSRVVGEFSAQQWRTLRPLIEWAALNWTEVAPLSRDSESVPRHYTFNKLMWWVVLDRGIQLAERHSLSGDASDWKKQRELLREDLVDRGYNRELGTFTVHYEGTHIDPTLAAIAVYGFLSVEDPRIRRTLSAIEKDYVRDNRLYNSLALNSTSDIPPIPIDCACWYTQCLALQGRTEHSAHGLRQVRSFGSKLGMFSNAYDDFFLQPVGGGPDIRAMSLFAQSIVRHADARAKQEPAAKRSKDSRFGWLFRTAGLKPPSGETSEQERADTALQIALRELRHEFYDPHYQRMEYHRIRGARSYQRFLESITALQSFDPTCLTNDAARRSFWLNVFNASVIHGIIELGLTHSVQDVPLFFDRIQHRVGHQEFTPMDIEHGILRGNLPLPGRRRNRFSQRDSRRALALNNRDPRIHFALYGGNRGAPYLDVYTAESGETLLAQAARAFISSTSHADFKRNTLILSQKLEWYRGDFPEGQAAFMNYLSDHFDDPETSQWLAENGRRIRLAFREYDWTLNN